MATNQTLRKTRPGSITVCVSDGGGAQSSVAGARISVYTAPEIGDWRTFYSKQWQPSGSHAVRPRTGEPAWTTDKNGCVTVPDLEPGCYVVTFDHYPETEPQCVLVESGCIKDVCFKLGLNASLILEFMTPDYKSIPGTRPRYGDMINGKIEFSASPDLRNRLRTKLQTPDLRSIPGDDFSFEGMVTGPGEIKVAILLPPRSDHPDAELSLATGIDPLPDVPRPPGRVDVRHLRSRASATKTFALWTAIRNHTKAISFSGSGYKSFIDRVLCKNEPLPTEKQSLTLNRQLNELGNHVYGVGAYELLKTATEVFLLLECGLKIEERGAHDDPGKDRPLIDLEYEAKVWDQAVNPQQLKQKLGEYLGGKALPYIERVIAAAFPGQKQGGRFCEFVLTSRTDPCFLELIWNYWHEEGMLVQSINAVSRRFQNVRAPGERDPLAHLEVDPLRPLNNILWGYVEDERNRLSVKRRTYEYQHHYGLNLYGKAVPELRPADHCSKFLEAFHNLLHTSSEYFKAVQDTTVVPDGYPLLHALKEVHLILAQGAHNQFGDLPWTARVEMLMQEWIMARPEMRDFLQSRAMVPYREGWMPQVDTMKTLQGWTDVTITHFRDLGVYGEQILLSIRYHNWNDINDEDEAKGWADSWRPEIQGYLHAYRAVTGVDLTNPDTVDYTLPSVHLQKRLSMQQGAR